MGEERPSESGFKSDAVLIEIVRASGMGLNIAQLDNRIKQKLANNPAVSVFVILVNVDFPRKTSDYYVLL